MIWTPSARLAALALLLSIPFVGGAAAQSTRPGSVYSRFGLGERIDPFQARSPSMGGSGYAIPGGGFASLANPALLADLQLTRAVAGLQFDNLRSRNAAGDESELSAGAFSGFSVGLPLLVNRLGMLVSLSPYTRVGYRVFIPDTFEPSDGDPVAYTDALEGNGGIDRVSLGFGYRLNERFAVGLRTDFFFGILEDVHRTTFGNFRYEETRLSESTRLRGFGLGLGARANFPDTFRDGDILAVGLTVDVPAHLTGERVVTSGPASDPDTLRTGVDGSVDLPVMVGAGVAWQAGPKFLAAADVRYERWSAFESSFAFPAAASGDAGRLDDRVRVSGGFEFYPAGRDLLAGFFRRTSYRLGAFFERSYASPVPDSRIDLIGLTGGISLPTLFPGTRVDVHAEVGKRGSTDGVLIQDSYFRLGVSINFADRWFVRRRLG